jgi:hypothetical protein
LIRASEASVDQRFLGTLPERLAAFTLPTSIVPVSGSELVGLQLLRPSPGPWLLPSVHEQLRTQLSAGIRFEFRLQLGCCCLCCYCFLYCCFGRVLQFRTYVRCPRRTFLFAKCGLMLSPMCLALSGAAVELKIDTTIATRARIGPETFASRLNRSERSSFVLIRRGEADHPAQIIEFLQVQASVAPSVSSSSSSVLPSSSSLSVASASSSSELASSSADHDVFAFLASWSSTVDSATLPLTTFYFAKVRWFVKSSGSGTATTWKFPALEAEPVYVPLQRLLQRFIPVCTDKDRESAKPFINCKFRVCPIPRKFYL